MNKPTIDNPYRGRLVQSTLFNGCRTMSDGEALLQEMDETLCIVLIGGKTRIFCWEESQIYPSARVPAFYPPNEIAAFLADKTLNVRSGDNIKRVPAFSYWFKRRKSPSAKGVTLDPRGGRFVDGQLNLWAGFGIKAAPGEWPLLRWHIENVACNGEGPPIDYVRKWLAWVLQNPERAAEVALVLKGKKGTGKGALFARVLAPIFGAQGLHISNREHLTGRFNGHLLGCCFLFLDEAIWPGDKPGEGVLKRMTTEPTLTIEAKGFNAHEAINRLSIAMASNEAWVVPASEDERRFAVFNVSDAKRGDHAYFAALFDETDNGGAAAFLHDMLAMDLQNWHPRRDIPATQGLAEQKDETLGAEFAWLWAILDDGQLPPTCEIGAPDRANVAELHAHFIRSDRRLRLWSAKKFKTFLEGFGACWARTSKRRYIAFPPLAEMRAAFLKRFPWHEPFDDCASWTLRLDGDLEAQSRE